VAINKIKELDEINNLLASKQCCFLHLAKKVIIKGGKHNKKIIQRRIWKSIPLAHKIKEDE